MRKKKVCWFNPHRQSINGLVLPLILIFLVAHEDRSHGVPSQRSSRAQRRTD